MNNVGYHSSATYLALPDVLTTSFPCEGQTLNVKSASAAQFDAFISVFAEVNEQNVDRAVWPIHHRWRAINACLAAGVLTLSELPTGYELCVPEVQAEEKPSEKAEVNA